MHIACSCLRAGRTLRALSVALNCGVGRLLKGALARVELYQHSSRGCFLVHSHCSMVQLDATCLLAQLRAVVEASSGDAAAICKALTDGLDELKSQSNDFTSVFAAVSLLPAESSFCKLQ